MASLGEVGSKALLSLRAAQVQIAGNVSHRGQCPGHSCLLAVPHQPQTHWLFCQPWSLSPLITTTCWLF